MNRWKILILALASVISVVVGSPSASASAIAPITTTNWAGYQVMGSGITTARATWTVPAVTWSGRNGYSAQWVGLGNGRSASDTLIQAGTESDAVCVRAQHGRCTQVQRRYWAWLETYPGRYQERINNLPVAAGNTLTTTVAWDAPTRTARFTVCNWTTNHCVNTTRPSRAPGPVAEVILERPAVQGLQPAALANFGTWNIVGADFVRGAHDYVMSDLPWRTITMANSVRPHHAVLANTGPVNKTTGTFSIRFAHMG